MLLVYCDHITPRIEYIFDFILKDLCGFQYSITTNESEYLSYNGPTLNYSSKSLKQHDVEVKPNGLLQLQTITNCQGSINKQGPTVQLFLNGPGLQATYFDVFAASFYLLTRYEEYLDYVPDLYGRFEAHASLLFKHNVLDRPLLNEWSETLRQTIIKVHGHITFRKNNFSYKITIDVDQAFAFRHRGALRNTASLLKNIITFNRAFLSSQLKTLFTTQSDPFDTFEYLKKIQEACALPFLYFINVGAYSKYDKNLPVTNTHLKKIINSLKLYAEIGVHPSYFSNAAPHKFSEEKKALEHVIQQPVTQSRQHYLKLHLPATYQHLIALGIREDYSMGYASHPGFRAGTCTPFQWFDLQQNKTTSLQVFPITYMENSFGQYLKMPSDEALQYMKKLTETVKSYDGYHICIWHNSTVNDQLLWEGWRTVFETSIAYILK